MSNPTVSQSTDNAVTEITGAEEGGAAILIDNVTKRYGGKKGAAKKAAVNQLTLEIPAGAVVMFVGRSGCGKTTTLKMINRLIEPTEGKIVINGEDVTHMNGDKLRRGIGYGVTGTHPPWFLFPQRFHSTFFISEKYSLIIQELMP